MGRDLHLDLGGPGVLSELERLNHTLGDVDYPLSIAKNDVLLRLAEEAMAAAPLDGSRILRAGG